MKAWLFVLFACYTQTILADIPEAGQQVHVHADPNWVMPTLGSTPKSRGGKNRKKEKVRTEDDAVDELPSQVVFQRLNERLASLASLGEQQLRRLEQVEYRLTKLEVQGQEKSEGVRAQVAEITRKMDSLDWDLSKVETLMEVVRQDLGGLRQGHTEIRMAVGSKPVQEGQQDQTEVISKLQMIMATLYGMRGMGSAMNDDIAVLLKNVTSIVNATSYLQSRAEQLVTKQYLRTLLLDHGNAGNPPPQAQQYMSVIMADVAKPDATQHPTDCWETLQSGQNKSGVYQIRPMRSSSPFFVQCEMSVRGGGWVVLHNRYEGTVDFYRGWSDYKHGFGNLGGEFWLGLEKMHLITTQKVYEIIVELQDFSLSNAYAYYTAFSIGSEVEGYPITILGSYEGDAGDSLTYHAGMKFSTRDADNDMWEDGDCAQSHSGAWWYNGCDTANLNGRYLNGNLPPQYEYQGMYWYDYRGPAYSLMKARIMIRPWGANGTVEEKTPENPAEETEEPAVTTTPTADQQYGWNGAEYELEFGDY